MRLASVSARIDRLTANVKSFALVNWWSLEGKLSGC
jgi:hypothetical protein